MKRTQKGFTLIELLVVIGILSILAVALLIAINPAEAQRKARDTQRLKDMSNIQAALEGYLNDNPGSSLNVVDGKTSNSAGGRDCNTGWLGIPVCNYMNRLPTDPRNASGAYANGSGTQSAGGLYYQVRANNFGYHICTRLESLSNERKMTDDGYPSSTDFFDVYSSTAAGNCTAM